MNYVGSQSSGHFPGDYDQGHDGYTIGQISGQASKWIPSRPNVVLLHAGTNDLDRSYDPARAPQRLGSLIDQILTTCPDVVVLVARIVPSKQPLLQDRISTFNSQIADVISQRARAGKHVLPVDMFDSFTTSDLADDLHPNDRGYKKMADQWHQAIEQAKEKGWIKNPVSVRRRGPHPNSSK